MTASPAQVLSPGVGWAVVISLAVGFSFLMLAIIWAQNRYAPTAVGHSDNDEFSSASRSVKPGLIAAGIVSAWTWAATLEQSAAVGYKYGVSGPYWYAAGATVQVLLFSIIGSNTKLNAPFANTWLQIFRARWGKGMHILFVCFALATNTLVSSMLILGGSATVNQLTGMPTLAACFITPIGIAIYVMLGGLRSSLIADYTHTSVLVCIILAFAFTVYATSDKIGSFSRMKELLDLAPPVEGNAGGSYLTMRSLNGFIFGIINICGNFGTIFADQSYFQRAVAAKGETATKGFILGGLAWFAVPMVIASSLGLAGRALSGQDPAMAILTADQVSEGLPAPSAAAALLGKSGALMMLFLLFLAVTSAASAQLVAVSSVLTFDVYQPYIKPRATARELFFVSHVGIVLWAVMMGVLGLIWYYIGISMGWLYVVMGIIIGPAVFPIFGCTAWAKANRTSALVGALAGEVFGLLAWLVSTARLEGSVTIATTNSNNPLLAGNLIAILLPVAIMVPWSILRPENYDWEGTRAINAPWSPASGGEGLEAGDGSGSGAATPASSDEKKAAPPSPSSPASPPLALALAEKSASPPAAAPHPALGLRTGAGAGVSSSPYDRLAHLRAQGLDPEALLASRRMAVRAAIALSLLLVVFVPCMCVIARTWTAAGLGVWISINVGWLFVSGVIVVLYPIWESRVALGKILQGMGRDIAGGRGKVQPPTAHET